MKNSPLHKTRILDFTRLIPGPYCTKILADLGATVIKIEDMKKGDYIGFFPPKSLGGDSVHSVYFNKNKKRLKLDFTSAEGRVIIEKLARRSDVLVESFRPGVMSHWGLGFKQIRRINKKILYASITGFGQSGKNAGRAGHDLNFLAESGFLQNLLDNSGKVQPPSFQWADYVGGGAFAALQICAALAGKKSARHLDISMTAAMAYLGGAQKFSSSAPDVSAVTGNLARYQIYPTRDGQFFCLGALEDKFWEAFCRAASHPEWIECGYDVQKNREVMAEVASLVASRPAREWAEFCLQHDVCASVLATREDMRASGMLGEICVKHGREGAEFLESGFLSARKLQSYNRAGDDNISVLKKLGYKTAQIRDLRTRGIIA